MTTHRDIQRRVTHHEAVYLFIRLEEMTKGCGYEFGLHGSGLLDRGGADVDVIAAPFPNHDEKRLLDVLKNAGKVKVLPYTWTDGFLSVEIITAEGFSIDLHIHRRN